MLPTSNLSSVELEGNLAVCGAVRDVLRTSQSLLLYIFHPYFDVREISGMYKIYWCEHHVWYKADVLQHQYC